MDAAGLVVVVVVDAGVAAGPCPERAGVVVVDDAGVVLVVGTEVVVVVAGAEVVVVELVGVTGAGASVVGESVFFAMTTASTVARPASAVGVTLIDLATMAPVAVLNTMSTPAATVAAVGRLPG